MAKKKSTHQDKPPQNQDFTHQSPAAMDEASEKLQHLKSLNSMLIKEAVDRRQQMASLVCSKESLESALRRSDMKNQEMQDELNRLNDHSAQLDLERDLVFVFVALQVSQQAEVVEKERDGFWREKVVIENRLESLERELGQVMSEKHEIENARSRNESYIRVMKDELSELYATLDNEVENVTSCSGERDTLRAELDVQIEETNGLSLKLIEAEKRGKMMEEEVQKLKVEYKCVMEGKKERERRIESLLKDKDSLERSLADSNKVIEGLRSEMEETVREKTGLEEVRNAELVMKNNLQIAVAALNEVVLGLQKEEQMLRANILDLEKRCFAGEEKEKQMEKEINELVNEKEERERSFENLVREKSLVEKKLGKALEVLAVQKEKIEEIIRKKLELEEVKSRNESEIVKLQTELSELRLGISTLEALRRDQTEKIRQLLSDVNGSRDAINRVILERDEARKRYDEEKMNGVSLRNKKNGMEKNVKEIQKVVEEMKAENCIVIRENKEYVIKCTKLMEEISTLENALSKARKEVDDMKNNRESLEANSELVLKMLRNTKAVMIRVSKEERDMKEIDGFSDENMVAKSVKPYVAELEAIKNAFKKREIHVEDMKRQLELLQNSVAEARKGKNFLTLVSSVTGILAAAAVASVAYVARGR